MEGKCSFEIRLRIGDMHCGKTPYCITNIVITLHINMKEVDIERVEVHASSKRPELPLHLPLPHDEGVSC